MSWYVLQHKPAQGDRAIAHLKNQDIPYFYPKVAVDKVKGGKRISKLEPLFPGYIFVNLEPTDSLWAKLRSTRGVLRVVGFSSHPAKISDEVIQHIKDSLEEVAVQGGIQAGCKVQLQDGPFEGLDAIFQAYDGEERAVVLIDFMQRQQRISVPVTALKR